MDVLQFYAMKGKERANEVKTLLGDDAALPHWLKKSWQSDTGYAFPSGHTMFAATWALLALAILWPRRHYKTVILMMSWAVIVMGSRLMLGMHWPRDLMASVGISAILVMLACWLTERFVGTLTPPPAEQQEIAQREADGIK
jgi:phosphatidylglycerophosphatase B